MSTDIGANFPLKINLHASTSHWCSANSANLASLEVELLSKYVSFFPNSNDLRKATILNVPINDQGNHIHEFFIENDSSIDSKDPLAQHVLFIHGFGASLGFFFKNFEDLSKIDNKYLKYHFIDMIGFGLSSRPKFPKPFYSNNYNDIENKLNDLKLVEEFFIDPIENWRINRIGNDHRFILFGHSLGGYISFAYSLKYPTYLKKLYLISPVGVERSKYSAKFNFSNNFIEKEIEKEFENHNLNESDLPKSSDMRKEIIGQEALIDNKDNEISTHNENIDELSVGELPTNPETEINSGDEKQSFFQKTFEYVWIHNWVDPLSFLRFLGPFGSKATSRWSNRRFSNTLKTKDEFLLMHKYVYYSAVGMNKSGECCITRLLAPGAVAYFPILDKIPLNEKELEFNSYYQKTYGGKEHSIVQNISTTWIYGDRDWMNKDAGKSASRKLNDLVKNKNFSNYILVEDAGHHVYLDNPKEFLKIVVNSLE